jgi:hypothetical protein
MSMLNAKFGQVIRDRRRQSELTQRPQDARAPWPWEGIFYFAEALCNQTLYVITPAREKCSLLRIRKPDIQKLIADAQPVRAIE